MNILLTNYIKLSMITITKVLALFSQQGKAFYPFFMASDYTPLEYSPYYVQQSRHRRKGQRCWRSTGQIFIRSTIRLYPNFWRDSCKTISRLSSKKNNCFLLVDPILVSRPWSIKFSIRRKNNQGRRSQEWPRVQAPPNFCISIILKTRNASWLMLLAMALPRWTKREDSFGSASLMSTWKFHPDYLKSLSA